MIQPLQFSQFAVHGIEVEPLRVKLAADPFQHILVALVLRVAYRLKELGVAPDPAAVLGRARPLTLDAAGILDLRLWVQGLFEDDLVLPGIAEVIFVGESGLPPLLTIWLIDTSSSSCFSISQSASSESSGP